MNTAADSDMHVGLQMFSCTAVLLRAGCAGGQNCIEMESWRSLLSTMAIHVGIRRNSPCAPLLITIS